MSCLLSICIPSYNRPQELIRLLKSLDISETRRIEVVICEDKSPKRKEIREQVNDFVNSSEYVVRYIENKENFGFDGNLRQCIENAAGEWIMYMGDDDLFVPHIMNEYIHYLDSLDKEIGYVLRAYQNIHSDGKIEKFDYFGKNMFFEAGFDTYVKLYRKSVFISGFCFRREYTLESLTNRFDGSLLYQLYIEAEVCMNYAATYFCKPITQAFIDEGIPYFGNSEKEKDLYTPGTITLDNSINFVKNFFEITNFIDEKYNIDSTSYVINDMSRYSYPILSIQRKKGRREFRKYANRLTIIGIGGTFYFRLYFIALYIFNEKICDRVIMLLKKIIGRTPKL